MTITEAEWAVMELCWERPGIGGREFVEALSKSRGWSRSTTLTLLRRLEDKGVTDVIVGFRWAYQMEQDTQPLAEKIGLLEDFAERVVSKCS